MMVLVSIDVEAARGVVASMRALVDTVTGEWAECKDAAVRALLPTSSLQGLADPLDVVVRLASELTLRVDLAVLYNTGDECRPPTQSMLSYAVSEDTVDGVKAQLGIELARALLAVDSTDEQGGQELHDAAQAMARYKDDPKVMSSLWGTAGSYWVDNLPLFLVATGSDSARADLEIFSSGFTAALHDKGPPEAFSSVAESFKRAPADPGVGWSRLAMLQFGDVPTDFLVAATRANALDILRDDQGSQPRSFIGPGCEVWMRLGGRGGS